MESDLSFIPLTTLEDRGIDFSLLDCCPSFDFCIGFLEDRVGLPMLDHEYRHFAVTLESERYSMSPAATMWKTNLHSSLKTILGRQQERIFVSCTELFSHSWSDVAFDHWPTRRFSSVLRRACLMIGRQGVPSSICTVTKSSRS